MTNTTDQTRFDERTIQGRDDNGDAEVVTIWIDYRKGGLWSVGRAVNIAERESRIPRPEDELFSGFELGDALESANATLDADLQASSDNDDHNHEVRPFLESELRHKLERWFFDHA
jgi:hypothetical protein